MPRKKSHITITDQFCGAGGSSQGAKRVGDRIGGVEIKLALNHWRLAIDTHIANFPNTDHDCTDISACDPRRYSSTDILITSPECTNHSLAKGKKQVKAQMDMFDKGILDPAAERSRATMWDVPRFAEYHNYNGIIVENVVDARKWVMFESWIHAMSALGYHHKSVYLNSMFCHPTPQSRDRMYIVFWKKGNKAPDLEYTPAAYCQACEKDISAVQSWKNPQVRWGVYGKRGQYYYCCPFCSNIVEPYYYAAFNCIDWSDFGNRIGDREKPLSPNTIRRIEYGLNKYGNEPMILHTAYGSEARGTTRSMGGPAFTQTSFTSQAMVMPFIIQSEHAHAADNGKIRTLDKALQTQTTRQSMSIAFPGLIVEMNSTGKSKSVTNPFATITAGGINQGIVSDDSWKSFIGYYYKKQQASHAIDALGTCKTHDTHFLINYKKPNIEDCYYRMLKAHELKLAMAFDKNYTVLVSSKNQVKQLGNAVTPPAMEFLVERMVQSLM